MLYADEEYLSLETTIFSTEKSFYVLSDSFQFILMDIRLAKIPITQILLVRYILNDNHIDDQYWLLCQLTNTITKCLNFKIQGNNIVVVEAHVPCHNETTKYAKPAKNANLIYNEEYAPSLLGCVTNSNQRWWYKICTIHPSHKSNQNLRQVTYKRSMLLVKRR